MPANIPYTTLENLYGDENRVLDEFFPSNSYINFGFYEGILDRNKEISREERLQSEEALYDYIFRMLDPQSNDAILEVGSGRGDGAARLKCNYGVLSVRGLDLIPEQVNRASLKHKEAISKGGLSFHQGRAEKMPFSLGAFSKIYSVEALQHFQSLPHFASECYRTLSSKGRVVVTTFFALDEDSLKKLTQKMPVNIGGVDNVKTLEELKGAFQSAGFTLVESKTIGQFVFPFFDQWLSQQKTQDWGRLWAEAWREGLLDYFVFTFEKS